MVGPFMQGMLLMGVIYWYSKGMLNMINDYYRAEFQKQIRTNAADKKPSGVDEIEALLKKPNDAIQDGKSVLKSDILESSFCTVNHELDVCFNETELNTFLEIALSICFSSHSSYMLLDIKEKDYRGCENTLMASTNSVLDT